MSDKYKTAEDQYADCDVCGERYWGEARQRWLKLHWNGNVLQEICYTHKDGK
jgi:hypothetical protein